MLKTLFSNNKNEQSNKWTDKNFDNKFDDITALVFDVCASTFAKLYLNFTSECWTKVRADSTFDKNICTSDITELVMNKNGFVEVFDLDDSSHSIEPTILIHDEKIRHFAGMPIALFDGQVVGAICVMDINPKKLSVYQQSIIELAARDIAAQIERLKVKDEFDKIFKLKKKLNNELDEFIYIASHDLKSPLNAIKNLMLWIEEDAENGVTEDNPKYYKMMRNSVDRINRLLGDLGNYSRVGREESTFENVNLKNLINQCRNMLTISNSYEFDVDDCNVKLPKEDLQLTLTHLVSNAIKHHDKGRGCIKIRCTSNVNYYQFSITDDGPGIPLELQEKIFQPFQTLKSKDEIESSGLGLAIVKKILRKYSGNIMVKSEIGLGASFIVHWPKNEIEH